MRVLLFITLTCSQLFAAKSKDTQPNVIVLVTDDQGYADLGRHGHPILKTPNLDSLYDQSARFSRFHVSPSCAPTRAALMSGKHEFKAGVTHTIIPGNFMNLKETTIAQVFKAQGYATGLFGKWHLGHQDDYRPEKRGFDVALTCQKDGQTYHYDPTLELNGELKDYKGYRTDILFDEALKFIEHNKNKTFFCYLPTYNAHDPLVVPDQYKKSYQQVVNVAARHFFAMLANYDENLGKLLAKLKEWQLETNTIIVFISDNGGTYGVDTYNAHMRGCKGSTFHGGTRAISLWRWPGQIKPRTIQELGAHYDTLPTLASLAGINLSEKYFNTLDGRDLSPLLKGGYSKQLSDRMIVTHAGRWKFKAGEPEKHKYFDCAVHWRNYQSFRYLDCGRQDSCPGHKCQSAKRIRQTNKGYYCEAKHIVSTNHRDWSLFDLEKDPMLKHNLASTRPEIVKQLSRHFENWWSESLPHVNQKIERLSNK